MVRYRTFSVILITLFLAGCSTTKLPPKTEIKYVQVPILVSPAPPPIQRPLLLLDQLTDIDKADPGKVVQSYKVSIKQLTNYIEELEAIIKEYDNISKKYDELRRVVDERIPVGETPGEEK